MKKGNCQNCGCRFRFFDNQITTEEDIFGNKTVFMKCPICGKHIEPKDWTEMKR